MFIDLSIENLVKLTSTVINIYQSDSDEVAKVKDLKVLFFGNKNMDNIEPENTLVSEKISIALFLLDVKALLLYFLNIVLDFVVTNGTDDPDLIRLNFQQHWDRCVSSIQTKLTERY